MGFFMLGRPRRCTRRCGTAALAIGTAAIGMAAIGWIDGAAAMPTCDGTFAATLIKPLPTPMVVRLDILDDSPANERMAARFVAGLREAGVVVGTPPNVVLQISTYRRGGNLQDPADSPGRGDPGTSDIEGGIQFEVPPVSGDVFAPGTPSTTSLLSVRIEATVAQTTQVAWVASVLCRIIGDDDGKRAQDMGRVIGGVLGQRIDRRPL